MKIPELDKISKVSEKSQAIGDFIEWLPSQGLIICQEEDDEAGEERYFPVHPDINRLLEKYFNIDGAKAERERVAILHELRNELEVKTEDGKTEILGLIRDEKKFEGAEKV